jgi:hypothetical protein
VEGWHTGSEWIDSGTLVERINFCADQLGDTRKPGVRAIIQRVAARRDLTPETLVSECLEALGHYELPKETRDHLTAHVRKGGALNPNAADFSARVSQVLQLIVSTQEYQFA